MMLEVAKIISYGMGLYLGAGLLFSLWFVTSGIRKAPVEGHSIILRLMLIPGAMLLWPLLILRKSP